MRPELAAKEMIRQLGVPFNEPGERTVSGGTMGHLIWMLREIEDQMVTGEKAHRWLGYAQGLTVMLGLMKLDQLKLINKEA